MAAGMLTKSPDFMLRRELLYLSPALATKSMYYPSTRVCFRRNTTTNHMLLSCSGVNHRLVLSVPHHKFDNVVDSNNYKYYCCSSLRKFEKKNNKPFVVNDQSSINSSCNSSSISVSVSNKVGEFKNLVVRMFATMTLFGFLVFMITTAFQGSAVAHTASTSSSLPSLSSTSARSASDHDDNSSRVPSQRSTTRKTRNRLRVSSDVPAMENVSSDVPAMENVSSDVPAMENVSSDVPAMENVSSDVPAMENVSSDVPAMENVSSDVPAMENELPSAQDVWFLVIDLIRKAMFLFLAPLIIPLVLALISGFKYYYEICKDDKEKSVLMLQVGILDKTRELQRELTKIAQNDAISKSYGLNLKEVVKALLRRYESCRLAHLSVTRCISDEEKKYGDNLAELTDSYKEMHSIDNNPPVLFRVYHNFKYIVKSIAVIIHWSLKEAIKKISYGDKCSKELFREVFSRELARHDRDKETFENADVMKYEMEAVGKARSMVDDDYLVVTVLVLARGVYSIPSLKCSTEHLKTVLRKFDAIPETKIESLKVLQTLHKEDEGASEQELQRYFPNLKPLYLSV